MKMLSAVDVHSVATKALGLDETLLDLNSIEALACLVRRAAGIYCPCPARKLIEVVTSSLNGICEDPVEIRTRVEATLEAVTANGDLFEVAEDDPDRSRQRDLLYLVPPAFVRRRSGAIYLLGVLPDGMNPLPKELSDRVEHVEHLRMLPASQGDGTDETLRGLGFFEIASETWVKAPPKESASGYLGDLNARLSAMPTGPMIAGLQILDSRKPVRYYRDRWTDQIDQRGRFVGRRPQAYGSPLWCYVEIDNGTVRLLDLPLRQSQWRGCDEALRLQAAIDHERGHPQLYCVQGGSGRSQVIELFSPIPMWARRRCETIGEPITARGCLLSFKYGDGELDEELHFLSEYLWLSEAKNDS